MKFFIFFLVFGFVIVSSSADEITETTGADFITTTEVTVPENDVLSDEIPVDNINLLRQSDNDAANESSTVHFTELACTKDNMEWLSCGPRCYQTCGFQPRDAKQRKSRAVCVSSNESGCYTGCFCKSGYVRLNDKCVLPTMCPSKRLITVKCFLPCWFWDKRHITTLHFLSFHSSSLFSQRRVQTMRKSVSVELRQLWTEIANRAAMSDWSLRSWLLLQAWIC